MCFDELGVSSNGKREGRMDMLRHEVSINGVDVGEIYLKPRVVLIAERMGMVGGCSMGIATMDKDGEAWDCLSECMRQRAWATM